MKKRKLGETDLYLSTVGLGTWAIGGKFQFGWGAQDDKESRAAILRSLEMGINWIDTAPVYGLGHSEEVVGSAIKGLSNRPIIATKCGITWDKTGTTTPCLKKKSIRNEAEASLKRLGIDAIDLYQIHWPDPKTDIEEAWQTISELVKEGKVRYGGVSNFSVQQLQQIESIHPVSSDQPLYNMFARGIEDNLLDYCRGKNIGVIVYSPMQQGLLTGKLTKERIKNLPEDDIRRKEGSPNFRHYSEPELSLNINFVNKIRPIAEKHGKTLAQLAIAWVLRRPEVTAAIVGTRRPSQIEETALASDWTLPQEDISTIEILLSERQKKLNIMDK